MNITEMYSYLFAVYMDKHSGMKLYNTLPKTEREIVKVKLRRLKVLSSRFKTRRCK